MAKRTTAICVLLLLMTYTYFCRGEGIGSFFNLKLLFPPGSSMGLFLALAIPLDLPNKNVFLAYNFEANYALPSNLSFIGEYPPVIERSSIDGGEQAGNVTAKAFAGINRKLVYDVLESKITTHGYPGRMCLLRAICETALYPVNETNGVFGDLVHIIFTPSSSESTEPMEEDYDEAENYGRGNENCAPYRKNCTVSILDLVSWVGDSG